MYRHQPYWYQRGLTQIASRFSTTFTEGKPDNLFLLPSFSCQDLLPDGVFLNPVSGLHYVLHLFDSSEAALDLVSSSGNHQFSQVKETVRMHDDRMTYIEGRHAHLLRRVDNKVAIDAELNDWFLNRSEEDWLVVQGLPRLSNDLSNQDWQEAAKKQVTEMIKLVLNLERSNLRFTVLVVLNPFRHITTRPPLYNVRMDSVASSKRIREIYSGFFRRERPMKLPSSLKGVSVRNKITLDTKIRLAILRELGSIYKDANKGSFFKAHGYDSRPFLVTTPPRGAGRPRKYTFMQAVTSLKSTFSDANLIKIFGTINEHHPGELQSLFVVIRDDDRERILALVQAERASGSRGRSGHDQGSGANRVPVASATTTSGFVFGSGSGMDVEANFLKSLRSDPPPPPSEPSGNHDQTRASRASRSPSRARKSRRSPSASGRSRSKSLERHRRSPSRSRKAERSPSRSRRAERSRSRDSSSQRRGLKRNHLSSSKDRDRDAKTRKRTRHRSSSSSRSSADSESDHGKKDKRHKKSKSKKDKKKKKRRNRKSSTSSAGSSASGSTRSSKAESAAGKKEG